MIAWWFNTQGGNGDEDNLWEPIQGGFQSTDVKGIPRLLILRCSCLSACLRANSAARRWGSPGSDDTRRGGL